MSDVPHLLSRGLRGELTGSRGKELALRRSLTAIRPTGLAPSKPKWFPRSPAQVRGDSAGAAGRQAHVPVGCDGAAPPAAVGAVEPAWAPLSYPPPSRPPPLGPPRSPRPAPPAP